MSDTTPATMLIVMQGLPASGKTQIALNIVRNYLSPIFRVNRDALRDMGHGKRLGTQEQEDQVTTAECAMVRALLHSGVSVVVDDTNLHPDTMEMWTNIAADCGVPMEVVDLTSVDEDTCVERDRERQQRGERYVGEAVIREMARTKQRVLKPAMGN